VCGFLSGCFCGGGVTPESLKVEHPSSVCILQYFQLLSCSASCVLKTKIFVLAECLSLVVIHQITGLNTPSVNCYHVQRCFGWFLSPDLKVMNLPIPKAELALNPTMLVSVVLLDFTAVTVFRLHIGSGFGKIHAPFLDFRFISQPNTVFICTGVRSACGGRVLVISADVGQQQVE